MGEINRYHKPGAGFLILKKNMMSGSSPPHMLALIREDGLYDIPKGAIEPGESDLLAAKRECFEECSIALSDSDMLFNSKPHKFDILTVFCASTEDVPTITINPHTGILEHYGFKWVDKDTFCSNCLDYLVPSIMYFYSAYVDVYNT